MNDNMHTIINNVTFRFLGVAVLGLLALFLLTQVLGGLKEFRYIGAGIQPGATISVSGEGEVFAKPDIAEFTYSVVVERPTVAAAQEAATDLGDRAVKYLKDQGVEEKDIKTTNYSVYPQYDYFSSICRDGLCPPRNRELRGYEVRQSVRVKVRDIEKAGTLLGGLGEVGITELSGLTFTIDDEDAVREEAREEAIAEAKERADALARDLRVKLVRVVSFNENTNQPVPYYRETYGFGGDAGSAIAESAALPAGENRIISNVHIVYEIR